MDYTVLFKTQPKFVKLISNSVKKNRLSQVYLLSGDKGTPKMHGAMYLANMILCEKNSACGKCEACINMENMTGSQTGSLNNGHLFIIDSTKSDSTIASSTIKKEQIEDLMHEFSLSSNETRVFIINNIERATTASSNTLLKFLEEMHENTYGILVTDNIDATLSTIKSRSQIISFEKISKSDLVNFYLSKSIDSEMATVLANLTNDVNEGMELYNDELVQNIVTLVKKINTSLINKEHPILLMNDEGKFLLNITDKKYHQMFIDLLITITNDRLYYLLGKHDEMVFLKTFEELDEYGIDIHNISYKDTFKQIEVLLDYKERVNYNLNLELMY